MNPIRRYLDILMETQQTRIHLSRRPVETVRTVVQTQPSRKPNGFWWAFDNQWRDFVRTGHKSVKRKADANLVYEVELAPDVRLIRLAAPDDFTAFTKEYGRAVAWAREGSPRDQTIDWQAVSLVADGIEIVNLKAPHPRLDWLDIDWNVDSGCAWNARVIAGLKLVNS